MRSALTRAVDRACGLLWARPLVAARPGMGWLLIEMAPAVLWTQLTGAVSLDAYYLGTYLLLLGASPAQLAWLPAVAYAGILLHPLRIAWLRRVWLLRRGAEPDPQRSCWQECLAGRALWLGTLLWPPLAGMLGLGTGAVLGGVLACILVCQVLLFSSMAAFMTWTQGLVPARLRGRFFAWRSLSTFVLVALGTQLAAALLPAFQPGTRPDPALQPWLVGMFAIATVVCIASTLGLAWSPAAAQHGGPPPTGPARLTAHPVLARLALWNLVHTAAWAATQSVLAPLVGGAGVDTRTYAFWQGAAFVPALLVGTFVGGWAVGRRGGAPVLLAAHVVVLLADASLLLLRPHNAAWAFPLAMAIGGLGRGLMMLGPIARLFELAPRGDTRFPALFLAWGGLGGLSVSLALLLVLPRLDALRAAGVALPATPWLVVGLALALRLAGTPLLLGRPVRDAPHGERP